MTDSSPPSRADVLVLARLSSRRPPTTRDLIKDLGPLLAPSATAAELRATIEARVAALASAGLLTAKPLVLTAHGRQVLAHGFGLTKPPTWTEARDRHLPALALGVPADVDAAKTATATTESLQAHLLANLLGVSPASSLTRVIDGLVSAELRLEAGPVTLSRVRAAVLGRKTGVPSRGKPQQIAARAAAVALRVPRADARTLRAALARRWISDETPARDGNGKSAHRTFDQVVSEAVAHMPASGRFGEQKVFISALWRTLQAHPALAGMSVDEFKRRLVAANQAGALSLARADLVGAMDPGEIAASEIRDLGSTFHFVLDTARR